VLRHVFPTASIPVIQVSIDATRPWSDQLAIGRRLSALRDDGVLLLGSGGIVHNLGRVDWSGKGAVPDGATRFEQWVCDRAVSGDVAPLADARQFDDAGRIAVPTPDHYLPLLTVLGSRRDAEGVSLVHRGYELGTISLTALRVG
jgi:4,5-DOPA dioxygenase extradiol